MNEYKAERGNHRGIVTSVLYYDIVINEFELDARYYIYILGKILTLLFTSYV